MSSRFASYLFIASLCLSSPSAVAATADEAKSLCREAIAYYQDSGKDAAFAEISDTEGTFRRGELYVFVYDKDGTVVAHGADPDRVGKNRIDQQDANGKYFGREIMEVTESGDAVEYVWINPETGQLQNKTTYVFLVDDYRFGCGVYQ